MFSGTGDCLLESCAIPGETELETDAFRSGNRERRWNGLFGRESTMSGETEIEVSVVSEEDLELEASRSSSTPAELLLQEKNGKSGCGLNNHHSFSFDVGKPALRPACNPQYTSFSISSILGRPESPPIDSTSTVSAERQSSDVDRGSPLPTTNAQNSQRIGSSCDSPARGLSSPTSLRFSNNQRGVSSVGHTTDNRNNATNVGIVCATSATSPASTFSPPSDASTNPLLGHQASADLAMLSRYVFLSIDLFLFSQYMSMYSMKLHAVER